MGSRCTISLYASDEPQAAMVASGAFDEIARIEGILTDYDPNSQAAQLTQLAVGQWHPVSDTLFEILSLSQEINKQTQGAFDPTIGSLTHLWRDARNEGRLPSDQQLQEARNSGGFGHLLLDAVHRSVMFDTQGMILDFGGIGKGFAADRALDYLDDLGYGAVMVNLGGDIALGDPPPDQEQGWLVEIQTGFGQKSQVFEYRCGIATSGDSEQFFEYQGVRYSHILDSRTGFGITTQHAATAIAPNATIADALASAISVLGEGYIEDLEGLYPPTEITLRTRPLNN
jgi:FAD:protein FMN transferase